MALTVKKKQCRPRFFYCPFCRNPKWHNLLSLHQKRPVRKWIYKHYQDHVQRNVLTVFRPQESHWSSLHKNYTFTQFLPAIHNGTKRSNAPTVIKLRDTVEKDQQCSARRGISHVSSHPFGHKAYISHIASHIFPSATEQHSKTQTYKAVLLKHDVVVDERIYVEHCWSKKHPSLMPCYKTAVTICLAS